MSSSALANALCLRRVHQAGSLPDYEAILEATYRRFVHPGDVVMDIGAHAGRHTLVLAQLVGSSGRVIAFEPLPLAQELLKAKGIPPNVELHPVAIAPTRGSVEFLFAEGTPEESGFRKKIYTRPDLVNLVPITVETRPLDEYAPPADQPVRFIKIDAEGAEVGCLESGRMLLARDRPMVTVEYGYPSYSAFGLQKESLFQAAETAGYVIGDLFGATITDLETWRSVCDLAFWDWYLVPLERVKEWQRAMEA